MTLVEEEEEEEEEVVVVMIRSSLRTSEWATSST
jgi:hypothetical protein